MNNLSPEKDDLSTNKVDNPFHRKKVNVNIKKLENILSIIASETGIPIHKIKSSERNLEFVFARTLFSFTCREAGYSYPTIGKMINKDHTSIMHYVKKAINNQKIIEMYEKLFKKKDVGILIAVGDKTIKSQKYRNIYRLYEGKCAICGFDEVVEIHHIVPRSLGGTDEPSNVIVLCPNHHALVDRGLLRIKDLHIKL